MGKKKTKDEFISDAIKVHGSKYDYSKVDFKGYREKVCIICKEHGEFYMTPDCHINGKCGCKKCANQRVSLAQKGSIEDFINKAQKIHGDKYDYSKVKYLNNNTKVCIICPIHGEFWQTPSNHLQGKGCSMCAHEYVASTKRMDSDDFISRAISIHGEKYDYSKVEYKNNNTKICIICPEHGEFWQRPSTHLNGCGCYKCGRSVTGDSLRGDLNSFIKKSISRYGDKFIYGKSQYKSATSDIVITGPIHGDFTTTPNAFLCQEHGCPMCAKEHVIKSNTMTQSEFIEKAKIIHGDLYDYSLVKYIGCDDKVEIVCPKHGVFKQTPYRHLRGAKCPNCESSHGETFIRMYLSSKNVRFIQQYPIQLSVKLFSRNNVRVDFYLPDHNTIVEFNGIQHYKYTPFFHRNEDDFNRQKERDYRLKKYCNEKQISLIIVKYNQIDKIDKILDRELKLNNNNYLLWQ